MQCPRCSGKSRVNRTLDLDYSIERNRRCTKCGRYFDTKEITIELFEIIKGTHTVADVERYFQTHW